MKRFPIWCATLLTVALSAFAGAVEISPDFGWPTRFEGRSWGRLLRSTNIHIVEGNAVYRNHETVTSISGNVTAVTRGAEIELSFTNQTAQLRGATAVIAVDGALKPRGGRGKVYVGTGSVATSARGVSDVERVRVIAQVVGTGARERVVGRLVSEPIASPSGAKHDADIVVVRFSAPLSSFQWLSATSGG